jgi:hypothetical protein
MEAEPPKAEPPKRKRRWFQFSLRTLLIFMMVCAVGAAWIERKLERARQQQEVVDRIMKSGGRLSYDYETSDATPPGPKWLRQLVGQCFFSEVVAVDFSRCANITDDDLRQLKLFDRLARLRLRETNITDAGLVHLSELTQLKDLCLAQTSISDAGLKNLKELSGLQELDLWDTNVSDAGLADLNGFAQLRELTLPLNNRISDTGIEAIQTALPKCEVGR